jgi:predicted molibdopterin-dependent oxidoreductase YjgC
MEDAASGSVKALLLLGEDASTLPGGGEATEALGRSGTLMVIDPFMTKAAEAAHLRMPAAAYSEFEGTWVNFKGRAQRVRRAVTPRAASLPCWQLLVLVLGGLGVETSYASAAAILREVAGAVPAFEGVSWTALGAEGRQLDLGPGAPPPEPAPKGLPEPAWVVHG